VKSIPRNGAGNRENVRALGELKNTEADGQAVFHPEPAYSKGYTLLRAAEKDLLPAREDRASVPTWRDPGSDVAGTITCRDCLSKPVTLEQPLSASMPCQRYPLRDAKRIVVRSGDRAAAGWAPQSPRRGITEAGIYQILGLPWAANQATARTFGQSAHRRSA